MTREQQIKKERRRRDGQALSGKRRKLTVNEDMLDRENFEYRFANDTNDRLHQLTVQDDWDVVTDRSGDTKDDATGMGSAITMRAGGGVETVLLRKPKTFFNDDYEASQARIDETEAALKRGAVPNGDQDSTYVPDGRETPVQISRG